MTRHARRRRPLLGGLAVALAVAAALVAVALWSQDEDTDETSAGVPAPTAEPSGPSDPQPRPLTADEVAEPTPGQAVATDAPAPADGGVVNVMITQAGWGPSGTAVEVSGFVSGVVEDGGTCRVTLTHDGETVTAVKDALADATTTACGVLEVGDVEMASGWWQAVLSYESATSAGESAPADVLVPTR
jgi:hypothetical protein